MRIHENIIREISLTIGSDTPERGGIMGASSADAPITHYYFDRTAPKYADCYIPDHQTVNEFLATEWIPRNILMLGIVHSHESSCPFPSCGDIAYAHRIIDSLPYTDTFWLPIYLTDTGELIPYRVRLCQGKLTVEKENLIIL